MNQIYIVGNLVADPEAKTTGQGKDLAAFRVAVKEGEKTQYFKCVAWERRSDVVLKYLHKGDKVLVTGAASCDVYNGKDGTAKGSVSININHVELMQNRREEQKEEPKTDADAFTDITLEDIPF